MGRFRTQQLVTAGGYLVLELPAGFEPRCDGTLFEPIALPATGECDTSDPTSVIISLNSTLLPSEYAFAIRVTPPPTAPLRNQLSLILKDKHHNVKDAAIKLPGNPIHEKLKLRMTDMHWTSSRALRPSTITLGFEAVDPLPDLIVAPDQQVSEVLILLPVGFTHMVEKLTDFTIVNEDMPLADPIYLDYMEKDRLRIILNLNRTSWTTLKVGTYNFRFPVLVPDPLPIFNVWHLSVCAPNFPGGCSRITDPAVLATWAAPGFKFGEAPASGFGATSGSERTIRPSCTIWMLASSLCLVFSLKALVHT